MKTIKDQFAGYVYDGDENHPESHKADDVHRYALYFCNKADNFLNGIFGHACPKEKKLFM